MTDDDLKKKKTFIETVKEKDTGWTENKEKKIENLFKEKTIEAFDIVALDKKPSIKDLSSMMD